MKISILKRGSCLERCQLADPNPIDETQESECVSVVQEKHGSFFHQYWI